MEMIMEKHFKNYHFTDNGKKQNIYDIFINSNKKDKFLSIIEKYENIKLDYDTIQDLEFELRELTDENFVIFKTENDIKDFKEYKDKPSNWENILKRFNERARLNIGGSVFNAVIDIGLGAGLKEHRLFNMLLINHSLNKW
jgi:hypothetical protein